MELYNPMTMNLNNPMGLNNQNLMNPMQANTNLGMMNQTMSNSYQNLMMPTGMINPPSIMNNQLANSAQNLNNSMMNNMYYMNNQNNYFGKNSNIMNLNAHSYQNINQNMNINQNFNNNMNQGLNQNMMNQNININMNQNINNMNLNQNQNMNNINNINQNFNSMNQNLNNMNQGINKNINNLNNFNANPINNNHLNSLDDNQLIFGMNNLDINVPKETVYNEPINYQVSEETVKLLNNNEISRGELISNQTSVSPTLQCPICRDLVMNPVECKNCSKLFCKYCIDNWLQNTNQCPNKHIFEKKEELDDWIKTALGKIFLKCPFIGCRSDYAYKYWKDHVKKCIFKSKGCKKKDDEEEAKELFGWNPIQFFVKCIDGRTHLFNLPLSTTVKELKELLEAKVGFKVEAQVLSCNGKNMENNKLLEFYGLQPNQTILQMGRVHGGNLIKI